METENILHKAELLRPRRVTNRISKQLCLKNTNKNKQKQVRDGTGVARHLDKILQSSEFVCELWIKWDKKTEEKKRDDL